ncbi:glycosyltransferase family 2 protein [Helicobacter typhlonius]|uniref:glycosyltransferase family 2 protein n=3 Tax=Helicobacter typhlonius TaxID=76936 RepID=UPI002FE01469
MSEKFPLVSIITIVYNDKNHIKETMDSVVGQDYERLEYIIIDGNSKDGTRETITEYIQHCAHITLQESNEIQTDEIALDNTQATHTHSTRFYLEAIHKDKPHLSFKFLSERDSGIYDAMNKGIDLATGEWCNFMNCGDRFYNHSTIRELFESYFINCGGGDNTNIGVIYGDTQLIYDSTHSKILYASDAPHTYHHRFIHQSAFITTSLMKTYKYDTSFKIAGDTDFFTKAYNAKHLFVYIPIIISSFEITGVSSKLSWQMFKEDCQIGYKYNRFFPLLHALKYLFWIIPRVCIRNAIPTRFRNHARILLGKKTS